MTKLECSGNGTIGVVSELLILIDALIPWTLVSNGREEKKKYNLKYTSIRSILDTC